VLRIRIRNTGSKIQFQARPPPLPSKLEPRHTGRIRKRGNCWRERGSVADPKQKFRIRSRIRLRPEFSFGFGSADPDPNPDSDPLVRGMDPRIRIRTKNSHGSTIPRTATCKCFLLYSDS
jgi:hypothetical protein